MANAVVAKGRDYVYHSDNPEFPIDCYYSTADGAPSCIIGYVLSELVPEVFASIAAAEAVNRWNDLAPPAPSVVFYLDAKTDFSAGTDNALKYAMSAAQERQDSNVPWGEVFDRFTGYLAANPFPTKK